MTELTRDELLHYGFTNGTVKLHTPITKMSYDEVKGEFKLSPAARYAISRFFELGGIQLVKLSVRGEFLDLCGLRANSIIYLGKQYN